MKITDLLISQIRSTEHDCLWRDSHPKDDLPVRRTRQVLVQTHLTVALATVSLSELLSSPNPKNTEGVSMCALPAFVA